MSFLQKLMLRILPKRWAEEMEADSRSWMLHCSACGYEHSIWEAGGIRWKGGGKSATVLRCSQCGKVVLHTVIRQQEKKNNVE